MNNMKPTKGYRAFQVINTIIMIFVIFITLYPFVYLVAQSFSSDAAASAGKVTFYPIGFNVNTYKYILRDNQFFRYYGNTIFYTVVGTFISVACTALIAYPLSKPRLRLNKVITPLVVFTMYFAGGMIPNYIVITQWLGLQDSMWSIILPNAISTFNLLVMKSFFAGLPEELEEAAAIDGMNTYQIFLKIIIPLSKPIISVVAIFAITAAWSDFLLPYLVLNGTDKVTVMVKLFSFKDTPTDAVSVLRASFFAIIPPTILFTIFQKQITDGAATGAVKG